ncbi:MAG TPA: PPE domain-containing protein [Pseudonocardiaceae bacterium]|nr:PPE domain-containing protein [Pseudonocardiaceae bacterium]
MTSPDSSAAGRTNFAAFTVPQLCAKLYAGNPASIRSAGATWDDTASSLHEQANRLERRLSGFSDSWQGGAADQYKIMMTDLVGGIRKVADTAFAMRNMDYEAADAMDRARAQMPAPIDVPVLAPTTVALASAPIQVDAGTPASVVMQIQQARANAIAAVQGQQQAVVASNAAQAQAIQVMQTLANSYVVARDSIPPSPSAQTAPTVTTTAFVTPNSAVGGTPIPGQMAPLPANPWQLSGDLTSPTPTPATLASGMPTPQSGSPLFGGMFTAGVAAASAAVFGRFGSVIPKVPAWANKNNSGGNSSSGSGSASGSGAAGAGAAGAAPKLGEKMAGGGVSLGHAGGLGGVKGIGGGFGAGGVPSAAPSLLSAAGSGGNLAAGVVGGAVGAAAAGPGTPMMPMMPMGGMGGGMGDMGGGRRIPPWLVETQDVWGESGAVSPTVIGEEPDLGGQHWLG